MYDAKETGLKIAMLRGNQSQEQLAEAIDVSRPCIHLYETGQRKVNAKALYNICKYFSVSADWLLGLSAKKERTD